MMSQGQLAALQRRVLDWYARQQRDLPWRRTRDPYAILVAEVMLQQTQVDRVIPKYREFLARFPTFAALAEAPTAEVIRAWTPLGYNLRAVRLQGIAREVMAKGGALPRTVEGLLKLKGLGPYTAAAVACFAFGEQTSVVDTNVRRVLGRILLGDSRPAERAMATVAREALPEGHAEAWNQALMDIGATLCSVSRPRCLLCPAQTWCKASTGLQGVAAQAAEARAAYRAQAPFKGSSRYYRGRIVERLRQVADGQGVTLAELGEAVKEGFTTRDMGWLEGLVEALARDGLVRREGEKVSLP